MIQIANNIELINYASMSYEELVDKLLTLEERNNDLENQWNELDDINDQLEDENDRLKEQIDKLKQQLNEVITNTNNRPS